MKSRIVCAVAVLIAMCGASSNRALGDDRWSFVGGGVNGQVHAVATWTMETTGQTVLVVGGKFTIAGTNTNVNNIAYWDGIAWNSMGTGVTDSAGNATVRALAVFGGKLYAGGDFATAGGVTASCIARWNPTSQSWESVAGGIAPASRSIRGVFSLLPDSASNRLYVGGYFSSVGTGALSVENVAWTDGSTWNRFGTPSILSGIQTAGVALSGVDNSGVWAITKQPNGTIGLFGRFTRIIAPATSDFRYASGLAEYLPTHPTPFIGGYSGINSVDDGVFREGGIHGIVRAAPFFGGFQYIIGTFKYVDNSDVNLSIARRDPVTTPGWFRVPPGLWHAGIENHGYCAIPVGSLLYIGGEIPRLSGPLLNPNLPTSIDIMTNNVVQFTGSTWKTMGSGVTGIVPGDSLSVVRSLAEFNDSIIVAGSFVSAGGKTISNRYSIASWKPCPGDLNHDDVVDDIDFPQFALAYDALYCPPGACPCDFNHDGVVDDVDFVIFATAYNTLSCPD